MPKRSKVVWVRQAHPPDPELVEGDEERLTEWGEPFDEFYERMERILTESRSWPVPAWGCRKMAGLYAEQAVKQGRGAG